MFQLNMNVVFCRVKLFKVLGIPCFVITRGTNVLRRKTKK
jgi:hypothetical protein